MIPQWKSVALGALTGAVLAVLVVFVAAQAGFLPLNGVQVRDYLMAHPGIVMDMTNKLAANQEAEADRTQKAALRAIGLKTYFDPKVAFVTGPANAKATIVEFFDYNCPYCRASIPAIKKYYAAHRHDTRFSFIEFPIKGPDSIVVARASFASRHQPDKYLAFHFALMDQDGLATADTLFAIAARVGLDVAKLKTDMADKSVDDAIDLAHKLALRTKIDGTPTFIFNGRVRAGAVSSAETIAKLMKGEDV